MIGDKDQGRSPETTSLKLRSQWFNSLNEPSHKSFPQTAFHIGPRRVITKLPTLIPANIRDDVPIDPRVFADPDSMDILDQPVDYYSVCSIGGQIDEVAKFLVKIALDKSYYPGTLEERTLKSCRQLSRRWAIAAIDCSSPDSREWHESDSHLLRWGVTGTILPMYRYFKPVQIIGYTSIPRLDFGKEHEAELRRNAQRFYDTFTQQSSNPFQFSREDQQTIVNSYILVRKKELAVKAALLNLGTK